MLAVRRLYARVSEGCRVDIVHQLNPVFTAFRSRLPVPARRSFWAVFWRVAERRGDSFDAHRLVTGLKRGVASLQQRQARRCSLARPGPRIASSIALPIAKKSCTCRTASIRRSTARRSGRGRAAGDCISRWTRAAQGNLTRFSTRFRAFAPQFPAARLIVGGAGHEKSPRRAEDRCPAGTGRRHAARLGGPLRRFRASWRVATVFAMPSNGETVRGCRCWKRWRAASPSS